MCDTGHFLFSGRLGSNKYLFEENHPTVHVYHRQKHVASFVQYRPIPEICRLSKEELVDWDVVDVAKKIIDRNTSSIDDVTVEKEGKHRARVTVKTEFFIVGQMLRLCSIEEVDNGYLPSQIETDSMDEFVWHVKEFLGNVQARIDEYGSVVYELKLYKRFPDS